MTNTNTQPVTFMTLPPEVRTIIYTTLFTTSANSILVLENSRATDHAVTTTSHGHALQTCRTIRNEARPHASRRRLIFQTQVRRAGHEAALQLPKLGQHLAGSLFSGVTNVTVGVTDLWRVVSSLGSLKTRMSKLKTIHAVVVKRMPYRYWRECFPTILSRLTARSPANQGPTLGISSGLGPDEIPDLELARFRSHVRSHPLINEDEHYTDDDEDGYTTDRGAETFSRPVTELSDRGLRLCVCARWILVERRGGERVVLEVETVFDLGSGRILEVRRRETLRDDGGGVDVVRCTGSVGEIERRTVLELHNV